MDAEFGGIDWESAFDSALQQSREATDAKQVDAITNELLGRLGDPYTRKLDVQAAALFNAERGGQVWLALRFAQHAIDCNDIVPVPSSMTTARLHRNM